MLCYSLRSVDQIWKIFLGNRGCPALQAVPPKKPEEEKGDVEEPTLPEATVNEEPKLPDDDEEKVDGEYDMEQRTGDEDECSVVAPQKV